MGRAGQRTIKEVRRRRLGVARRNLGLYAVMAAVLAAIGASIPLWAPPLVGAFFAGVLVTTFVAFVAYSLTFDGSQQRMMGAEAERWTSAELRKVDDLRVFDRMEFADRDVDHIAVAPGHVLAAETKWTSWEAKVTEDGVEGLAYDALHHARRAADRVRKFLASEGIDPMPEVLPVLVLWGPRVARVDGGYRRIGDVRVVIGAQAEEWRQRLAALPRWSTSTKDVLPTIEVFVDRFEQHQRGDTKRRRRSR